ncbi:SRCIN1 [Mytilus coruscus]|uniref:SRCIN1 n=1 Tax=Mytilus coruscus TaxID=42192 RepID=A0A6J8BYS2_MYTCO|nr:SRCIN1 [Mytilus coruscus]
MNPTEQVIWRHHNNKARRPRDPHRRATVVTYNPANVRDYEDFETMSNVEGPVSFQRGSFMRNSLPIVRSPPNTYDRAMGMVFLVYQDETKKSDLPNEITHLDTVRALFVRSFQEKLNMEYLSSPKRKIYILDPRTSIYYQLEDLRDIKDRTVLKLLESDSDNPQKVRELPPEKRGKRSDQGIYETPATAITDQKVSDIFRAVSILRQVSVETSDIGHGCGISSSYTLAAAMLFYHCCDIVSDFIQLEKKNGMIQILPVELNVKDTCLTDSIGKK